MTVTRHPPLLESKLVLRHIGLSSGKLHNIRILQLATYRFVGFLVSEVNIADKAYIHTYIRQPTVITSAMT